MSVLAQLAQYSTYDYSYSSTPSSGDAASIGATVIIVIIIFAVLALINYVLYSLGHAFIFKKAGIERWQAWVPIYQDWKLLQLGGQPGWWSIIAWILLPFGISIVGWVFIYIAMYNIGLKLQKESWFIIFGILIPPVWFFWAGLDSSKWDESAGAPRIDVAPAPAAHKNPAATPSDKDESSK